MQTLLAARNRPPAPCLRSFAAGVSCRFLCKLSLIPAQAVADLTRLEGVPLCIVTKVQVLPLFRKAARRLIVPAGSGRQADGLPCVFLCSTAAGLTTGDGGGEVSPPLRPARFTASVSRGVNPFPLRCLFWKNTPAPARRLQIPEIPGRNSRRKVPLPCL